MGSEETNPQRLVDLIARVRACRVCAAELPHEPRPVVRLGSRARIVVIGQAPGSKVHASGVPWDDASGDHLRSWLGVDDATFADPDAFAIVPMGFCYPGRRKGGDLPPRKECAPLWHEPLLSCLPTPQIRLLVGRYAQEAYLGKRAERTLTDTVRAFASYLPEYFALPHPSWRSKLWMAKNPWFETEVLPELRRIVADAIRAG